MLVFISNRQVCLYLIFLSMSDELLEIFYNKASDIIFGVLHKDILGFFSSLLKFSVIEVLQAKLIEDAKVLEVPPSVFSVQTS